MQSLGIFLLEMLACVAVIAGIWTLLERLVSGSQFARLGMKLFLAVFVSTCWFLGLWVFMDLTSTSGQVKSEIGKMRRQVGALRASGVRREDFTSRNLAIATIVKDIQASHQGAFDTAVDRLQEQDNNLKELRSQVKEFSLDLEGIRRKLPAEEAPEESKDGSKKRP